MARTTTPIGTMRHRVVLERITTALDGARAATPVTTLWAAIEPIGGGEADVGAHVTGTASHRLTLRWRSDITSADRFRLGARVFTPLTVIDPDETKRVLVITAREENR
jgi:SPP1 family predicted phage head-tail adaptor